MWNYSPTITVNGIEYTDLTFNQVTIEYGRARIFDYPRAGYARLDIANLNNTVFPFAITDSLVIKLKNASGVDKTVFTGVVTDVGGKFRSSDITGGVGIVTLTAVAPMAQMSRIVVGTTAYPQETDAARITRILNEAGVTIDVIDDAIYTLAARPAGVSDAFTLANTYASMVLGSIYETTDGKIGFANEGNRRQEAQTLGFTSLPLTSIIPDSVNSNQNIADVLNVTNLSYASGSVSKVNPDSQTTYGVIGSTISTEIVNVADATAIAETIINLRSIPQTSLSSFAMRMLDPTLTVSQINKLVTVYFGMPISIAGLPNAIYDGTYEGYVEGWNWSFSPGNITLTLKTSQEAYSYRDTRWQEVDPALTWNSVAPTLQWQNYG